MDEEYKFKELPEGLQNAILAEAKKHYASIGVFDASVYIDPDTIIYIGRIGVCVDVKSFQIRSSVFSHN